jgi:ubiquinone/menaquinone biosynthesis C-methylase UbiE
MSERFARYYDNLMRPLEKRAFQEIRKQLVKSAVGDVVEIGSGSGANFPFYTNVNKVTALEPNSIMREKARTKLQHASVPVELIDGHAEYLPFPDDTFDSAVSTLVFCTIADPAQAINELRRVCKNGAPILFFEHVRIDGFKGRVQDILTPLWKRLCDGCCLNRETLSLIECTGMEMRHVTKYYHDIFIKVDSVNRK